MNDLRMEKVRKFEEFLDGRLKPDLVHAFAQRDKVLEQQKVLYPVYLYCATRSMLVLRTFHFVSGILVGLSLYYYLLSSDLRRNIENLEKNSVTSMKTLVNIGSEVYMQAEVPDTRRIFVDVGLGFHVEFTWSEALDFITTREEKLARQMEEYTQLIASIKAKIKMVCEGIRELLQIPITEI